LKNSWRKKYQNFRTLNSTILFRPKRWIRVERGRVNLNIWGANYGANKKGLQLLPSETLDFAGGSYWIRTSDPLLVRQML
jgi:hypothetical protein